MKKGKLSKYAEIRQYPNVVESYAISDEPLTLSQTWDRTCFKKKQDIVMELGCGKGDYTINLARKYPEKNFIGVDIKGARLWKGATTALEESLDNVLFLRTRIELLAHFFPEDTISEIWLTFPDPHVKNPWKNRHKRLTSERFLEMYSAILKPGGQIHLKTDNETMYYFSKESFLKRSFNILQSTDDLYNSSLEGDPVAFQTVFEKRYLKESIAIKYLLSSI
ncbi:MAG: tRNA (guanosine(46)-N7)-methyltransferase TrmB [bacterium]|nr:tRNA (guanosine(46)-N7)-methyltransferase TrmB [bacterium]